MFLRAQRFVVRAVTAFDKKGASVRAHVERVVAWLIADALLLIRYESLPYLHGARKPSCLLIKLLR